MIAYLLGLATLPALFALWIAVEWVLRGPRWTRYECTVCDWRQKRSDHPHWPRWVWLAAQKLGHDWRETPEHKALRAKAQARHERIRKQAEGLRASR